MLPYILTSALFIAYLEILGQYFLYKLKKNIFPISFGFGFLLLMAYGYITVSIPATLGWSFYYAIAMFGLFVLTSLVFIFKDFKRVNWHFNRIGWLVIIASCAAMLFYSYNTTLGDLNGFDSTYYLNLISSNIGVDNMNYIAEHSGYISDHMIVSLQYTFQSYYVFVSCFIYLAKYALSLIGFRVFNVDLIVWIFQIVFDGLLLSLIVNGASLFTKKKHLLNVFILFVFVFFYGKLYYNSVFGFYGNSMRTMAFGYCALGIYGLVKENRLADKMIILTSALAGCSFSSSSTFIVLFLVFGLFFAAIDFDDNFFKEAAILLIMPLINLYSVYSKIFYSKIIAIPLIACMAIFVLNNFVVKICRKKHIKTIILVIFTLSMFALSYKTTGNLFDFSAFFDSNSGKYDMTLNYAYPIGNRLSSIFCLVFDVILLFFCIFYRKDKFAVFVYVLLIAVFNPFCVSFLNSIDNVYYRAYDLFLNPFTFTLYSAFFFEKLKSKYIYCIVILCLFAIFIKKINFIKPSYYHESFVPGSNYNPVYKMNDDEIKVIDFINEDRLYKGLTYPHITTPNLLCQANMPGRYTFSRTYLKWYLDKSEYDIYAMFYPYEYYGDPKKPECDYSKINEALWGSNVDYLVVDHKLEYYDEEKELYIPLYYLVYECNIPVYENDSYSVFYFER